MLNPPSQLYTITDAGRCGEHTPEMPRAERPCEETAALESRDRRPAGRLAALSRGPGRDEPEPPADAR